MPNKKWEESSVFKSDNRVSKLEQKITELEQKLSTSIDEQQIKNIFQELQNTSISQTDAPKLNIASALEQAIGRGELEHRWTMPNRGDIFVLVGDTLPSEGIFYVCFISGTWTQLFTSSVAGGSRTINAWIDPTSASTTVAKITIGPMPFAGAFVKVTLKCKEGETNGATAQLVDIHKQTAANENNDTSTTVFTTTGNRPTITNTNKAGSHTFSGGAATPNDDVTTFAKGDWLYIYSDQLGTGLTALSIGIEVTPI